MNIEGIDVSVHQGQINWKAVKTQKEFAFIRLGWAGYDGRINANGGLDKRFHENMNAALDAGIKVGVYVYSYCKGPAAARTAARETAELIAPYALEYPVVFDIEDPMHTSMSSRENTDIAAAFLSEIRAAGYYPMLYTYKYFASDNLIMSELGDYDFWLAQYTSKPTYAGEYGIWQYTGAGRCVGISTDVDLNVSYKDYPAIIRAAGLNHLEDAGSSTETPQDDAAKYRAALIEARKIINAALEE